MGFLLGGVILAVLGLSGIAGIREWWPLIIIAIGIIVIIYGVSAAQRSPRPD